MHLRRVAGKKRFVSVLTAERAGGIQTQPDLPGVGHGPAYLGPRLRLRADHREGGRAAAVHLGQGGAVDCRAERHVAPRVGAGLRYPSRWHAGRSRSRRARDDRRRARTCGGGAVTESFSLKNREQLVALS